MNVIFSQEVENYLFELIEILYKKEYFGFKESAVRYVEDLVFDINKNLPKSIKRLAPAHFLRYGKNLHYSTFRKNKNTDWYVFFSAYNYNGETIYLIRYITNNHVSAQYL